jgi:hypothetical protein
MEFKKAEMVELHNSNVVLHTENYSDGVIGWTGIAGENEEFYLDGQSLSTFLEMIGMNINPAFTVKNKPIINPYIDCRTLGCTSSLDV